MSPAGPWPAQALEDERRFGSPSARLYHLVGKQGGVDTPRGQGTLESTVASKPGHCRVLLTRGGPQISHGEGKKKTRGTVEFSVEDVYPYAKEESG